MTAEQKRIQELEAEVASLKALVKDLMERIDCLRNRKNSRNSSVPPSKDENRPRKTKSLRTRSGKNSGGQAGHEGSTLQMTDHPHVIIEYKPLVCFKCGNTLLDVDMQLTARRQIVDIPPIVPKYTEHRIYSTVCTCGCENTGTFPSEVKAPISYGTNVEAIIAYLYSRQYLPSERMQEFFRDVFNLPVSEGAIYNILGRFVQKSIPAYKAIKQTIENSKVVGSDETGIRINGNKNWGWTWQNKHATFITISPNRGTQTIANIFEKGIPNAVLVHDCWKPHFKSGTRSHQLCLAHLLRELNYLEERYKHPWANNFRQLLLDAIELKKTLNRVQYYYPLLQRTELEKRLDKLIHVEIPYGMKDLETFQNRLYRYKQYLFTFLYHPDVPPDNNASERAIRNIKVKQKISGQFKSSNGAQGFAILRSITDTCLKNKQNVLNALNLIAKLQPE